MTRKFSRKTTVLFFVAAFALGAALSFLTPQPAPEESRPPPGRRSSLFTEELARKPEPAKPPITEPVPASIPDAGEDNIHVATGLVVDEGFEVVMAHCIRCHSDKLISQNRATRDGWKGVIRWMQQTQNLGDLGPSEDIILDYLARNYAPPENQGRRPQLENIEWYQLEPDQG